MNLISNSADIYIKDEGYCDVRCHRNLKAMQWCYDQGYENALLQLGDTYCGEPVWKPGLKTGMYSFGLTKAGAKRFAKAARAAGLTVESEFESWR